MSQTRTADRQISLFNNLSSGEIILGQGVGISPTPASFTNLGAGSSVFKQTTSNQIQLRSILAGSTKISVTENANDISLNIVEANLSGIPTSAITGLGTIATQDSSNVAITGGTGQFNFRGLSTLDSGGNNKLIISSGEDLTTDQRLDFIVNDSTRFIDLSGNLTVSSSAIISGTNTGDQNIFSTIAVSGESNVVADTTSDTLTLIAGSNITITTNAGTDSITIASSGGSGVSDGDKGDITVSSSGTVWTVDNDSISYAKIQNVSATDRILGRFTAGAGDIEEITCTSAGRALIDDADASAQRTTLGLKTGALVNISVGTSAPGSPSVGDIWIDTN